MAGVESTHEIVIVFVYHNRFGLIFTGRNHNEFSR